MLPSTAMSFSRPLAFRRLFALPRPLRDQRRNAQVADLRFFQTRVEPRVVDKYREKLEKKLKSEGVSSIDELKEVYKEKIEAVRSEAAVDPAIDAALKVRVAPETTTTTTPFNPPPSAQQPAAASSPIASAARTLSELSKNVPLGVKTLSSFVDLHKLSIHEDPKDIELIWRARFVDDHRSLCAVMPTETYQRMEAVARRHPMFLLPLPREGQGVEMHLLQWTFPAKESTTIIFTTLADYKQRGEFALPHTTVTHHLELAESKKMVLVQGHVAPERGVSVDHARLLVMALQKFYGAIESKEWERRRQMLEMFSRGDEKFSIDALIEEAERAV